PELRQVQAVERRNCQPRGGEGERLGGHPPHEPRLQEDVQLVLAPARAHPGRAAGRHQGGRSGGGRPGAPPPPLQQFELIRRAGKEEEPVVRKGRQVEVKGGRRTAVSRLQADPPQLITRRGRLVREDLEPVQRPDQITAPGPFLSHELPPRQQIRPISPSLDYSTPASAAHATSPSANAVATRRKDALGVESA